MIIRSTTRERITLVLTVVASSVPEFSHPRRGEVARSAGVVERSPIGGMRYVYPALRWVPTF